MIPSTSSFHINRTLFLRELGVSKGHHEIINFKESIIEKNLIDNIFKDIQYQHPTQVTRIYKKSQYVCLVDADNILTLFNIVSKVKRWAYPLLHSPILNDKIEILENGIILNVRCLNDLNNPKSILEIELIQDGKKIGSIIDKNLHVDSIVTISNKIFSIDPNRTFIYEWCIDNAGTKIREIPLVGLNMDSELFLNGDERYLTVTTITRENFHDHNIYVYDTKFNTNYQFTLPQQQRFAISSTAILREKLILGVYHPLRIYPIYNPDESIMTNPEIYTIDMVTTKITKSCNNQFSNGKFLKLASNATKIAAIFLTELNEMSTYVIDISTGYANRIKTLSHALKHHLSLSLQKDVLILSYVKNDPFASPFNIITLINLKSQIELRELSFPYNESEISYEDGALFIPQERKKSFIINDFG